jgi:3-hydroxyisobutyrate dehydrogenase
MGAPQARLIAKAGHELAVFDPHPPALKAFEGKARLASSAADAAKDVAIACVCVRDDAQVEEAVFGPGGYAETMPSGALLLIHSTIRPDTLQALKERLAAKNIALVDAPVSRTRRTDDDKFVITMLGGAPADIERAKPLVDAFSTDIDVVGPLGSAMAAKISNNMITWLNLVTAGQAFTLAARYGVPPEKLRAILKANGNTTLPVAGLLDGKLAAPDSARSELMESQSGIGEKDLALAIAIAEAAGLDVSLPKAAKQGVRATMTSELGKA